MLYFVFLHCSIEIKDLNTSSITWIKTYFLLFNIIFRLFLCFIQTFIPCLHHFFFVSSRSLQGHQAPLTSDLDINILHESPCLYSKKCCCLYSPQHLKSTVKYVNKGPFTGCLGSFQLRLTAFLLSPEQACEFTLSYDFLNFTTKTFT